MFRVSRKFCHCSTRMEKYRLPRMMLRVSSSNFMASENEHLFGNKPIYMYEPINANQFGDMEYSRKDCGPKTQSAKNRHAWPWLPRAAIWSARLAKSLAS